MPETRLSLPETAAMLALMAEAREVSNPDLQEKYGFSITGKTRARLNNGLVDSRKVERGAYAHVLTDDGWAWCRRELTAGGPPPRAGSAGGALYAVLAGLHRYLDHHDLQLSDIFTHDKPAAPSSDVEGRIRAAYEELSEGPEAWVALADVRSKLTDLERSEIDETLRLMNRRTDVHLVPESNQKALDERDREAAVTIGNQEKHLLSIGA